MSQTETPARIRDADLQPFTDEAFTGIPVCPAWCDPEPRQDAFEDLIGGTSSVRGHDR